MGSFFSRTGDRRPRMPPDWVHPVFEQNVLNDYDPKTYECPRASAPRFSYAEVRGRDQGDLFDTEDYDFYVEHMDQNSLENAYSDVYLDVTKDNPEKLLDIGVAYTGRGYHASIVIHDITGARINDSSPGFLFSPIRKRTRKGKNKFADNALLRQLHLVIQPEEGGESHYDLRFEEIERREFTEYHHICCIRTTDRLIKYNARMSFPESYKMVVSDCCTFVHNFVLNTLTWTRYKGFIDDEKMEIIKKNLVRHNTITDGNTGETEATSRTNKVLGELAGTSAEASARSYVAAKKA